MAGIIQKALGSVSNLLTAGLTKITGIEYQKQASFGKSAGEYYQTKSGKVQQVRDIYSSKVGKVLAVGQNAAAIALATAVTAGGAAGAAATTAKGTAIVLKTAASYGLGLAATNLGVGVISSSPKAKKVVKSLAKSDFGQFGEDIGKTIENPTGNNLSNIYSNNPALTILGAGVIAAVGGKAAVGLISSGVSAYSGYQNRQATQENTQAILGKGQGDFTGVGDGYVPNQGYGISNISGQPLPLGQNSSSQPRRRTKTKKTTNIMQKVNIMLNNQSNNRTIKQKIYKEVALAY